MDDDLEQQKETPTLRLFSLLEVIAQKDEFISLQGLVEETGFPKPTLHRMLQQLESAGIIQKDGDDKHYSSGVRLRKLAENLLLNSTMHSARHAILKNLREEVGENCNLTALSGGEIIYLDRVETDAPLRFYLHPGSRVPVHCSASGKLFLAHMSKSQRSRLIGNTDLSQYTSKTITDFSLLEKDVESAKIQGYAIDNEEYLPGLVCIAVLVPSSVGHSNLGLAIQAPVIRVKPEEALKFLPALLKAAKALAQIEEECWEK
ncbi:MULTISPECIES: IclR family transcriptional regulator [Vibrio]|uniref:HTH-type transcriptional repressor AllR n=1 Tax=Vibrio casei TaxID=673372 RepID=A0A368LIP3_9VIBR|nr:MULTISPECIES: IclR family transcriptional regulator [Vibrio]RCS70568.1 IclR family transcriptional regulator [Vibrio casei]SJN27515.1 Transcriptional regulator, IclR family [Vibrio casei]HBV77829.1 IclR family transcriptional regulator [Vibrio sp.]